MNALREILARFGIEVDTKQLEVGNKQVDNFADKLRGFRDIIAGAFVVSSMGAFIKSTFEEGNHLYTLSRRAGMAVESYQALEYTGELLNVSSQQLAVGLKYLHRNLAIAANGGKGLKEVFENLGISIENGVPVDTEQAFRTLADSISQIEDKNLRTAAAMRIFGRAGASLLPMLNAGSSAIDQYSSEVAGLGGGFKTATTEAIDSLDDQTWRQKMAFRSVRASIIDTLLPSLESGSRAITSMSQTFVGLNHHGEAVRTTIISFGVMALSVLSGLGSKLSAVALAGAKLFLIAAALEDIYVWLRGGNSLIGEFFAKFAPGANEAAKAVGDTLELMMSDWDTYQQGVEMGWASIAYNAKAAMAKEAYDWDEYMARLQDAWAKVRYFFTGMGDTSRSRLQEFRDRTKGVSREQYAEKVKEEAAKEYWNDPSVKAFSSKFNELRDRRDKLKEQQRLESMAERFGGNPADYTKEALAGPLNPNQQKAVRTMKRKEEVDQLVTKYGGSPNAYWSGQGQATPGMVNALRDMAKNTPDALQRKDLAGLFDKDLNLQRSVDQATALKILEPSGLGDVTKLAETAVQGPAPFQVVPSPQNLSKVKTYTDNSRNTINLSVSKSDKGALENLGRSIPGGMSLREKMAAEDEDVYESEE